MNKHTTMVIELIGSIPAGKVCSYGQLASFAAVPGGARAVARILHSCTGKHSLPWWRVVRSSGEIALPEDAGGAEQRERLLAEGVEFQRNGFVNLRLCGCTEQDFPTLTLTE